MKRLRWEVLLGFYLVALSAIFYFVHYLIFHDPHHIFIYLIGDIAFVPIEVLLVTMIIHRLLEEREKRSRLEKLNMVIETFFSEVGTGLLTYFSNFDPKLDSIRSELIVTAEWTDKTFSNVSARLRKYDYSVRAEKTDLNRLREFLLQKRDFMVRLMENPALLEHESFTDLLMAVFHLTEEITFRSDTGDLPDSDYDHLSGDMKRVYHHLVHEWLEYMKYLKNNYPYLFSLSIRTNPFDREASPIVK